MCKHTAHAIKAVEIKLNVMEAIAERLVSSNLNIYILNAVVKLFSIFYVPTLTQVCKFESTAQYYKFLMTA